MCMKPSINAEEELYAEVGKRLSELRKINNLTQNNVEEKLGVKQESLSMIESGNRRPSVYLLKQLVNLYDTSYDKVLGSPDKRSEGSFSKPEQVLESIDLLYSMCENAGSQELKNVVTAYINMCVYCIIRELYEANPRNTAKLFSVDKAVALEKTMKYIEKTPEKLSAYIKASSGKVKKNAIEPPLEKAAVFREFIKQSESFLNNL